VLLAFLFMLNTQNDMYGYMYMYVCTCVCVWFLISGLHRGFTVPSSGVGLSDKS
jgi:hypothetical protein